MCEGMEVVLVCCVESGEWRAEMSMDFASDEERLLDAAVNTVS